MPVSRGVNRSDSTSAFKLGCEVKPGHRRDRAVGDVEADLGAAQHAGGLGAADVVRVEVDRHADLVAQRLDQSLGGHRLAQPGHVLDGDQVGAALLELLGEIDVIRQVVLGPLGIEDIARVADRRLAERAGFAHRLERQLHVRAPS